jgi:S1-C subfamily serine protease
MFGAVRRLAAVTLLDVCALAIIGLAAFSGFRRGLVVGLLSLGGLAAGGYAGAKIAPHVLPGDTSVYPPLVTLTGAVIGAGIGQILAVTAGRSLRELLSLGVLRALDNVTGALLGAVTGFAFVWFIGSVLLYTPGDTELRQAVQRSHIAGSLISTFPPSRIIDVLSRIDPFQALTGLDADVGPGDPALLRDRDVVRAARSVVRITGNACGLGIEGSGWVAARGYVVTNAHVVAGVRRPWVDRYGPRRWRATVVAFDADKDLAVLRVPGLSGRALPTAPPATGIAVIILGYPEDRPLRGVAGRLGNTVSTFVRDAYGRFPVARAVTPINGVVRPGNSGGPAVDGAGRVRAVVFARRAGEQGGFAVPVQLANQQLRKVRHATALATACAE